MKVPVLNIILALTVVVLATALIFSKCGPDPQIKVNPNYADSVVKIALDSQGRIFDSTANWWVNEAARWRRGYDSLAVALVKQGAKIQARTDSFRIYKKMYLTLLNNNDSSGALVACGQLINQVDSLVNLVDQAKVTITNKDSATIRTINSLNEVISTMLQEKAALKSALLDVQGEYNQLVAEVQKSNGKKPFAKTLNKILGAALAIVTAIALIK